MEHVGPPRGAMDLLRFFASEPDFDTVLGDLSEEFQRQISAFGQATARRWYWRETVRNARAFAKRELLRTPVTVLLIAVLIFVGLWLAIFFGGALLERIRWAWIPIRFWRWYRSVVMDLLFPTAMISGAGVLASRFLKERELSLIVAFATVSTCADLYGLCVQIRDSIRGRLTTDISVLQVTERFILSWFFVVLIFSLGCVWIRWHQRPRTILLEDSPTPLP
jgi:hypothetical protein